MRGHIFNVYQIFFLQLRIDLLKIKVKELFVGGFRFFFSCILKFNCFMRETLWLWGRLIAIISNE